FFPATFLNPPRLLSAGEVIPPLLLLLVSVRLLVARRKRLGTRKEEGSVKLSGTINAGRAGSAVVEVTVATIVLEMEAEARDEVWRRKAMRSMIVLVTAVR